jgi:hypothetical protein
VIDPEFGIHTIDPGLVCAATWCPNRIEVRIRMTSRFGRAR